MTTDQTCTSCNQPLPPGSPLGLCPQCLLKGGFYTGSASAPRTTGFTPPTVEELTPLFPQLEILELIGRGGMGAVYKARQPRLNRLVALKLLAHESDSASRFHERFLLEAQALARLNHPNIVTVYDFGEAGSHFYLVMEYVDGLNLRELLHSKKLAPSEALAIVPPICDAMQYAHERGIVHRDIKPENILLDKDGRVKLADFGIAKLIHADTPDRLTADNQRIGTPHYMAPEQVEKPNAVDHRADIYSLGVVFYEMLTGELPLGRFSPPSRKVQIDVRLDEIVLRALEKEPELRYQRASEIRTKVETLSTPAPAAPAAPPPPSQSPQHKGLKIAAIIFAVLTVAPLPLGLPERVLLLVIAGTLTAVYLLRRSAATPPLATPPPVHSRLSHHALIGAIWGTLGLIALVGALTAVAVPTVSQPQPAAVWLILTRFILLPLGLAAPFAATILGYIGWSNIRRSGGRIYGLPLAIFDILLYPLLITGAALMWSIHFAVDHLPFEQALPPDIRRYLLSKQAALILSASITLLIGALIARSLYRTARPVARQQALTRPTADIRHYLALAVIGFVGTFCLLASGYDIYQFTRSGIGSRLSSALIPTLAAIGALWVFAYFFRRFGGSRIALTVAAALGGVIAAVAWAEQPHSPDHVVRGQVVDTTTGNPIAGAEVYVVPQDSTDFSDVVRSTRTDTKGHFKIGVEPQAEMGHLYNVRRYHRLANLRFHASGYTVTDRVGPNDPEEWHNVDLARTDKEPEGPVMSPDGAVALNKVTLQSVDQKLNLYFHASNYTSVTRTLIIEYAPMSQQQSRITHHFQVQPGRDNNLAMPVPNHRVQAPVNRSQITVSLQMNRPQGELNRGVLFRQWVTVPHKGDFHLALLDSPVTSQQSPVTQLVGPTQLRFKSGVNARLLGIANHPPDGRAWDSTGVLLPSLPAGFEKGTNTKSGVNENQRANEFYIQLGQLPRKDIDVIYRLSNSRGHAGGPNRTSDTIQLAFSATFPASTQHTDISVGVAAGDWETIVSGKPRESNSYFNKGSSGKETQHSVAFSDVAFHNGGLRLTVTDTVLNDSTRLAVVDTSGTRHTSTGRESSSGANFRQTTYFFDSVTTEAEIGHLEFQSRAYEWKTFRNVPLQPKAGHPQQASPVLRWVAPPGGTANLVGSLMEKHPHHVLRDATSTVTIVFDDPHIQPIEYGY